MPSFTRIDPFIDPPATIRKQAERIFTLEREKAEDMATLIAGSNQAQALIDTLRQIELAVSYRHCGCREVRKIVSSHAKGHPR